MASFRAIAKGYHGDVIHDPETDHHVIFDAPDDWCVVNGVFKCSWAVREDGAPAPAPIQEITAETLAAEELLNQQSAAATPAVAGTLLADPPPAEVVATSQPQLPPEVPAAQQAVADTDDIPVHAGTQELQGATGPGPQDAAGQPVVVHHDVNAEAGVEVL